MKVKNIGSNMTLCILCDGAEVMFSYETPVAGHDNTGIAFRTTEKYSVTTTKHINKYLRDSHSATVEKLTSSEILELLAAPYTGALSIDEVTTAMEIIIPLRINESISL